MDEFMTTSQAATKWDITVAEVSEFCRNGLIEGAKKNNQNRWIIPINAPKPVRTDMEDSYPQELLELRKMLIKEINNQIKLLKKEIGKQEDKIGSNYMLKNSVSGGLMANAARNASDKRIEQAQIMKKNYEHTLEWFEKVRKKYK